MDVSQVVNAFAAVVSGVVISNSFLNVPYIFTEHPVMKTHYHALSNCLPDLLLCTITLFVVMFTSNKLAARYKFFDSAGNQMILCHALCLLLSLLLYFTKLGNKTWKDIAMQVKSGLMTQQVIMITVCFLVYKRLMIDSHPKR